MNFTVKTGPARKHARVTTRQVGVALCGCGHVGTAVAEIIAERAAWLREEHGIVLRVRHIVVRDPARERAAVIDRALLRAQFAPALSDSGVDVVVEVIGGTDVAGEIVRTALHRGKHVVTANKALVAAHGAQLEKLAGRHRRLLRYEAAVGGAIPVLQTLRNALPGSRITRIRGILNGTTNFILTRMHEDGLPFFRALAKSQSLGYAEADPRADITGADAAQKLVILARHAFGAWAKLDSVQCRGIDHVSLADIDRSRAQQRVLKLVAEAAYADGVVHLSVKPEALAADDALAGVHNVTNVVEIHSDFAGPLLLQGRGAGGRATASAVYGDLVETARQQGGR